MYRFGCTHLLRGVNQVEYTDTYNYTDICRYTRFTDICRYTRFTDEMCSSFDDTLVASVCMQVLFFPELQN